MLRLPIFLQNLHTIGGKRLNLFTAVVVLTALYELYNVLYSAKLQPQYQILFVNHTNDNSSRKNFATVAERNCSAKINLPVFDKRHSEKLQVFFLETSGRPYLKGRQVCSVESAAIKSGLISKVIMKSSYLDLSKRKSFCDLFHNYKNVQFYTINYEELFRNTPVEGITGRLDRVAGGHKFTHYSDLGRLAIVYKYGGYYMDLDVIVTKDMRPLTTFLVIEMPQTTKPDNKTCNIREGSLDVISIHNGEFGFPAGHEFLLQYMESANRTYDPMSDKRNQVGPSHAVLVATQMYKTRLTNRILDKGKPHREVTLIPDYTFLPVVYHQAKSILWSADPKTPQQWEDVFRCAYAVHFYSHYNDHRNVSGDPTKDAYSFLGPKHCPQAFSYYKTEF
ncbi:lactosylceramide 4-alpha-galactosyltransferase-like [Convolutriloba macropyga]|uniref:lactosylceramide 4-alpha-galactosyltransferase-like n=1 Tax=Convolutriloba macropyga TaxID=536237 RepID=UPI003F51CF7F